MLPRPKSLILVVAALARLCTSSSTALACIAQALLSWWPWWSGSPLGTPLHKATSCPRSHRGVVHAAAGRVLHEPLVVVLVESCRVRVIQGDRLVPLHPGPRQGLGSGAARRIKHRSSSGEERRLRATVVARPVHCMQHLHDHPGGEEPRDHCSSQLYCFDLRGHGSGDRR